MPSKTTIRTNVTRKTVTTVRVSKRRVKSIIPCDDSGIPKSSSRVLREIEKEQKRIQKQKEKEERELQKEERKRIRREERAKVEQWKRQQKMEEFKAKEQEKRQRMKETWSQRENMKKQKIEKTRERRVQMAMKKAEEGVRPQHKTVYVPELDVVVPGKKHSDTRVYHGKSRISIEKIISDSHRRVCLNKRLRGLLKKMIEICELCGSECYALLRDSDEGGIIKYRNMEDEEKFLMDMRIQENEGVEYFKEFTPKDYYKKIENLHQIPIDGVLVRKKSGRKSKRIKQGEPGFLEGPEADEEEMKEFVISEFLDTLKKRKYDVIGIDDKEKSSMGKPVFINGPNHIEVSTRKIRRGRNIKAKSEPSDSVRMEPIKQEYTETEDRYDSFLDTNFSNTDTNVPLEEPFGHMLDGAMLLHKLAIDIDLKIRITTGITDNGDLYVHGESDFGQKASYIQYGGLDDIHAYDLNETVENESTKLLNEMDEFTKSEDFAKILEELGGVTYDSPWIYSEKFQNDS